MTGYRSTFLAVALTAALLAVSCTHTNPQISISSQQIPRHWLLSVQGAGFTPTHNISSHLRRADGSEFAVLPILTDSRGAFTHTIDTMILELGTHELWVVDDASGKTSNHVTFDVTFNYPAGG
jgi:hypothetical protein